MEYNIDDIAIIKNAKQLDPQIIDKFENETQTKLPIEYKKFILKYGGGRVYNTLYSNVNARFDSYPDSHVWPINDMVYLEDLVISEYKFKHILTTRSADLYTKGEGGTYFGVSVDPSFNYGAVYYFNPESGAVKVEDNFTDFISKMFFRPPYHQEKLETKIDSHEFQYIDIDLSVYENNTSFKYMNQDYKLKTVNCVLKKAKNGIYLDLKIETEEASTTFDYEGETISLHNPTLTLKNLLFEGDINTLKHKLIYKHTDQETTDLDINIDVDENRHFNYIYLAIREITDTKIYLSFHGKINKDGAGVFNNLASFETQVVCKYTLHE